MFISKDCEKVTIREAFWEHSSDSGIVLETSRILTSEAALAKQVGNKKIPTMDSMFNKVG